MEPGKITMATPEYSPAPIPLRYKKLHPNAISPKYAYAGDSGMDLYCPERTFIPPGSVINIDTGIAFEIPQGYEIQIRLRSGAAMEYPLVMPNAPATIDSGYRGSVGIIVRNVSMYKDVLLEAGERIAQAVLCPVSQAVLIETTDDFARTERGTSGYGQSGRF